MSSILRSPLATALALSLGAAIALGLTRFSYGLLLPPMRLDLGWSYFLAGAMNTYNAAGYFIGALITPALMRRVGVCRLLVAAATAASLVMLLAGLLTHPAALSGQRFSAGIVSAFIFICGGVLASRLGSLHPERAGLIIGLYYGGTGIGIVLSALLVPLAMNLAQRHGAGHAWQWAWMGLGAVCLAATVLMASPARRIGEAPPAHATARRFAVSQFMFSLSAYFMFGVGYIGYMTFVVALLKQQGMRAELITAFYALLGLAVIVSPRIWARMLDRYKGGESLAILNLVLGAATVLPALSSQPALIFLSGLVFGAVFLSVVASTTAMVRHNLPQDAWPAGISSFTIVFALGQIVGPSMAGWIADGLGGLERGLIASACALMMGAALAWQQRPLPAPGQPSAAAPRATAD